MTYPAGIYGSFTDVYDADTLPTNFRVGMEVVDPDNGLTYKLVQAEGAIANNKACTYDPAQADAKSVKASDAQHQAVVGVNNTGVTVADEEYFWMIKRGVCTALLAASVSAGATLASSGTSGTLAAAAATDYGTVRATALAASGGGGATAIELL